MIRCIRGVTRRLRDVEGDEKHVVTPRGKIQNVMPTGHRVGRSERLPVGRGGGVLGLVFFDFRDGLRYVRNSSVLLPIFVVEGGWGLGNGVARSLYSLFGARLGVATAAGFLARPTDFGISVLFIAMVFVECSERHWQGGSTPVRAMRWTTVWGVPWFSTVVVLLFLA